MNSISVFSHNACIGKTLREPSPGMGLTSPVPVCSANVLFKMSQCLQPVKQKNIPNVLYA
jgi:hypothetical protein